MTKNTSQPAKALEILATLSESLSYLFPHDPYRPRVSILYIDSITGYQIIITRYEHQFAGEESVIFDNTDCDLLRLLIRASKFVIKQNKTNPIDQLSQHIKELEE